MPSESFDGLDPLPDEQWSLKLRSVLEQVSPILNVHRVIAHHPDLMAAWTPLRQHITTEGSLDPRSRELVILRVAHRSGVAYEWHHHVARARTAGMSEEEIESVRSALIAGWPADEAALLNAVDDLFDDLTLRPPTRESLGAHYSTQEILDLIFTVGVYVTLAMLINSARIEIEDA